MADPGTDREEGLIERSRSDDELTRALAALSLASDGGEAAFDRLLELLQDPNWSVVSAAAHALGQTGDARAGPPLAEALNRCTEQTEQDPLARARQIIGPGDKEQAEGEIEVRRWAALVEDEIASALGRVGDIAAVPALRQLLSSDWTLNKKAAALALATLAPRLIAGGSLAGELAELEADLRSELTALKKRASNVSMYQPAEAEHCVAAAKAVRGATRAVRRRRKLAEKDQARKAG